MRVELESTDKIVTLELPDGTSVPARIWEGRSVLTGIECHAYITRIAVHQQDNAEEFAAELQEHRRPRNPDVLALPARLLV